jgi:hypothetical protein
VVLACGSRRGCGPSWPATSRRSPARRGSHTWWRATKGSKLSCYARGRKKRASERDGEALVLLCVLGCGNQGVYEPSIYSGARGSGASRLPTPRDTQRTANFFSYFGYYNQYSINELINFS